MPLAALLIVPEHAAPRIMGADPIAFHLRRARAVGVGHAVIHAERISSTLLATVDALRAEGMSVDIGRTVLDAAELVHPDEAVLLIPALLVIPVERLRALSLCAEPTILCVRDEATNERYERIDATARWTGFARIDGGVLRRTAAMVGDWDFASTLMRRAVQEGAARAILTAEEASAELMGIDDPVLAQAAARRMVDTAPAAAGSWAARWLVAPLARVLARAAGDLGIEAQWTVLCGLAFLVAASLCALAGFVVASLSLLLIGLIIDRSGGIGTQLGAGKSTWDAYRARVRILSSIVVAVATGITLTLRTGQWGCAVLALLLVGVTILSEGDDRDESAFNRWPGNPADYAIIMLSGFVIGIPVAALALCAGIAAFGHALTLRNRDQG